MRVIAVAALLFLFAVGASWGSAGQTPASHVKTRWRATIVAGHHKPVYIVSISCASPGNCSAVGSYTDKAGAQQGLLLTEKAGHWATGVKAVLPANAASDPQQVMLTSVSCASAGNCTGVGTYIDGSEGGIYSEGGRAGLLLTEKAGHWARGVEAVLPADAAFDFGEGDLESVSCASAGNCTAVGSYNNSLADLYGDGGASGLLLTEKAGHWAAGVEAVPPDGLYPGSTVALHSVSCASAGNCTAVGNENQEEDIVFTEKAGHWARAVDVSHNSGAQTDLLSVSCSSAGSCSAVGYSDYSYSDGGDMDPYFSRDPLLLTKKRGKWRLVHPVFPPGGPGVSGLSSVSCASDGDCSAVGTYNEGFNDKGGSKGVLLTETAGKWRRGVRAEPPKDGKGYYAEVDLGDISCASPGNCTAVGHYTTRTHGFDRGILLTEIAGKWARGVRAPRGQHVLSVSCAAPGNCGAVAGSILGGQRVLLDGTTAPCVVPTLDGKTLLGARQSIESHNCSVGTIEHAPSEQSKLGT